MISRKKLKDINDMKYSGVYGVYMKEKDKKTCPPHIRFHKRESRTLEKTLSGQKELSIRTEIGTFGLESTFDEFLLPEQDTKLLYHVDGRETLCLGWTSNIQQKLIRFIRCKCRQLWTKTCRGKWRMFSKRKGLKRRSGSARHSK